MENQNQEINDKMQQELGARKYQLSLVLERKAAAEKRIATLNQRIAELELVLKPQPNPNQLNIPLKDAK